MSLAAGETVSTYRLVEKLGEGGMGVVWRAVDTRLEREVAVKFIPDRLAQDGESLGRFQAEARAVAAISHPSIVTIHAIGEEEGRHFFTMELVRGRTLGEVVPAGGLPFDELMRIAIPLVEGVAAAHERGITHRDLKPRNIMVTPEGQVKILDFGLAKRCDLVAASSPDEAVTRTLQDASLVSGTVPYMAPEQLRGEPPTPLTDLFALGVILHEMAAGRHPFPAGTSAEVMAAILKDEAPPLSAARPDLPRHLERIIARCLEKDPQRRIQSARELREALAAVSRQPGPARDDPTPSIAVLPFADMSSQKDQDYFCDGIAEEIITTLSRIQGLRVASRTSSFRFKGASMDVREIGDRLGVKTLLEGSVRKSGERLRITAELVASADGYQIWSERYDRELKDVFAIQEEIAQTIAERLKGALSPYERRAIKQVATTDVKAYEFYLRGRQFFNQYGRRAIEFALQMFRRAIEVDPSYAAAHAGVADCCSFLYLNVHRTDEYARCADEASAKALALDPDLAEALVARGVALSLAERHEEAERAFETALHISPRLFEAHYFYARDCFVQGRFDKAVELYIRASEIRPEDYQSLLLVGQIFDDLGRHREASEARREGTARAGAHIDLNPDDVRALYMGANGLVSLGERERGLQWARRALEIAPDDSMVLYNVGCVFSLAGELDGALDCLERAFDVGFAHRGWFERDSNLDALRKLPRFIDLVKRVRAAASDADQR